MCFWNSLVIVSVINCLKHFVGFLEILPSYFIDIMAIGVNCTFCLNLVYSMGTVGLLA